MGTVSMRLFVTDPIGSIYTGSTVDDRSIDPVSFASDVEHVYAELITGRTYEVYSSWEHDVKIINADQVFSLGPVQIGKRKQRSDMK
jgi:hypothetical protein